MPSRQSPKVCLRCSCLKFKCVFRETNPHEPALKYAPACRLHKYDSVRGKKAEIWKYTSGILFGFTPGRDRNPIKSCLYIASRLLLSQAVYYCCLCASILPYRRRPDMMTLHMRPGKTTPKISPPAYGAPMCRCTITTTDSKDFPRKMPESRFTRIPMQKQSGGFRLRFAGIRGVFFRFRMSQRAYHRGSFCRHRNSK